MTAGRRTISGMDSANWIKGARRKEAHDLRHPGAGDALAAGDLGLVGCLAGLEEGVPLEGLAEEIDHNRQGSDDRIVGLRA